jgi:hypothetical protein
MDAAARKCDFQDFMKFESLDFISGQFHARIQMEHDRINKMKSDYLEMVEEIDKLRKENEAMAYNLNAAADVGGEQSEWIEKLKELCLNELNDPLSRYATLEVSDVTDIFGWKIEKSTPKYTKAMNWKNLKKVLIEYNISKDELECIADLEGEERTQKACEWLEKQESGKYEITEKPIMVSSMEPEPESDPEPLKMDDEEIEKVEEIEDPISQDDPQTLLIKGVFESGLINMAELGVNKQYSDAMEFKLKNPKSSYEDFMNQGGKKSPKKKPKSPKKKENPDFNNKIEDLNIQLDRNIAQDYWICKHNRQSDQIVKQRAIETFKMILKEKGLDIEKIPQSKWDKLPQGKNLRDVDAIRYNRTEKNHNIVLYYLEDSKGFEKNEASNGRLTYRFAGRPFE